MRSSSPHSRKLRQKVERLALLFVLATGALGLLNWSMKGLIHSAKEVTVPDLNGKTVEEALEFLSQKNLGLKKEGSEFNASVPIGTITRQKPEAGMTVREGKVIRITLSQGGEKVIVPELTGLTLRSAEIALRNNFLSLGEISQQPSLRYEKNRVIFQDPQTKTIVEKNSIVHITLSEGPPPEGVVLMPNFIGKNWDAVEAWSKESKISVERSGELKGRVSEQTPVPDTKLSQNSSVKIVLSTSLNQPPPQGNSL